MLSKETEWRKYIRLGISSQRKPQLSASPHVKRFSGNSTGKDESIPIVSIIGEPKNENPKKAKVKTTAKMVDQQTQTTFFRPSRLYMNN